MKSMTGYGRARNALNGREITVEVRAVNHRYLDVTVKAPRAYGFLEEALKREAGSAISRGKVDIFVAIEAAGAAQTTVRVDKDLAENYLKVLTELRDHLKLQDDITVMQIARMPDVLVSERVEEDAEQLTADVVSVFTEAVAAFSQMRLIEGDKMRADVEGRLKTIEESVTEIEKRAPERVVEYRQRLEKRMNEILADTSLEPQRILAEAAIFADKTAVDEETVRLRSHLHQMAMMLADTAPVGRKLDFLVQEMNREINTIGSKANDVELANIVVNVKSEIEKIREQIQNIE